MAQATAKLFLTGRGQAVRLPAEFRFEGSECRLPCDAVGFLFLEAGLPVQPDPALLARCPRHAGARRGHWPSSSEIGGAMPQHYQQP